MSGYPQTTPVNYYDSAGSSVVADIDTSGNISAPSLDTRTASTLFIGQSTATKVEIADSGVTTEMQGPISGLTLTTDGPVIVASNVLSSEAVLNVTRGGTGAATHTSGNFLEGNGTGAILSTKAVPTGAVVGTTDTQTLSNKSLVDSTTSIVDVGDNTKTIKFDAAGTTGTSTTLLSSQTANRVLTMPDVTDTLVARTTTDTLTNKSLVDSSTSIVDVGDNTKTIKFDAAGTTGTSTTLLSSQTANRVLTMPNVTDTLVARTTTDTLTNKSLVDSSTSIVDVGDNTKTINFDAAGTTGTSTTLLSSQTANRILTMPDVTDTLVARTTTDTLTNKTMTASSNNVTARALFSASGANTVSVFAAATPSSGQVLTATGATTATWQTPASSGNTNRWVITDEKTTGTNGGTFTSGAWQTRDLNKLVKPSGTGSDVTISSNQITITSGTYYVWAHGEADDVKENQVRFRNVTDGSTAIVGHSSNADKGIGSFLAGIITPASTKTYELQHRCDTTRSNTGFGVANGFGEVEVYSTVVIIKLA